jgi:transcriptional regulator with XRE-family HTH domain
MKPPRSSFSQALRFVRVARGMAQEEFDVVSSRTYISALERGLKQPTLTKVDDLAEALKVHPLTLLALSYSNKPGGSDVATLLAKVAEEVQQLANQS